MSALSSAVAMSSGSAVNVAGTSSGCIGTPAVERGLEPLVQNALVRRVHVDEHESVPILREHEDSVQLRQRKAERMVVVVGQVGTVPGARGSPNNRA